MQSTRCSPFRFASAFFSAFILKTREQFPCLAHIRFVLLLEAENVKHAEIWIYSVAKLYDSGHFEWASWVEWEPEKRGTKHHTYFLPCCAVVGAPTSTSSCHPLPAPNWIDIYDISLMFRISFIMNNFFPRQRRRRRSCVGGGWGQKS